jgi:hypothetical protein
VVKNSAKTPQFIISLENSLTQLFNLFTVFWLSRLLFFFIMTYCLAKGEDNSVKSWRTQNSFSRESSHWLKKRNVLAHAPKAQNSFHSDRPQSFICCTRSGSNLNPKFTEWELPIL